MTVLPDRLAHLDETHLDEGVHSSFDDGHCAMEAPTRSKYASRETTAENFWAHVNTSGDCWLWIGRTDEKGYGRVGYRQRQSVGTHRVAWALTHGGDLPAQWVLHRCDNPPCVRPEHLFLGSARDNNVDRQAKGRTRGWPGRSGPDHHAFVVTEQMAAQMRAARAAGATQQSIADQFGVSRGHIARIVSGVLPRHAKGAQR